MDSTLSKAEQNAKNFVLNLLLRGFDGQSGDKDDDFKLPIWYDDAAFKKGQKYFGNNRLGIMVSNMLGMFSLISEPNGAKLLDKTGKSSTAESAKKRYASTVVHMISWYECDLAPGSKSWESLKRVRKMHSMASRIAEENKLNTITATAMSMTQFGFMGYALVRPHYLGIKHDNDDDRKAFVHFWAVIGHMLGIKDEFNMCLHKLEEVEIICRIFMRYAFIPFLQFETPTFEKLGRAFIEGMSSFIPFMTFESRLFLVRRMAGVPGYQYGVDMSKEIFQRQIFSSEELQAIIEHFQMVPGHEYRRQMVFDEKVHLLTITRMNEVISENENREVLLDNMDENRNVFGYYKGLNDNINSDSSFDMQTGNKKYLMEFLGLKHPNELRITEINEQCIGMYLNDHKFYELSAQNQRRVNMVLGRIRQLESKWTKYLQEAAVNINIFRMNRFLKN